MTNLELLKRLQKWFADDRDQDAIPGDKLDECAACLADALFEIEQSRKALSAIKKDADECLKLLQKIRLENL